MKRIPRIKFPQRHAKPSSSGSEAQPSATTSARQLSTPSSDVQMAPTSSTVGGKASLQPKRTPVSNEEIEAVLLGGCI